MIRWIKFYVELCFLKVAPQDAPTSMSVYYTSVIAYFLVGAFVISLNQTMLTGLFLSGLQTALLMFLANLVLWIRKTPERFYQTMTALCATGAIIGLVALPVMSMLAASGTGVDSNTISLGFLVWLVLILWESVVIGHILRHAMDISMVAGLAGSFIYMYLSFAITVRILKIMSVSLS